MKVDSRFSSLTRILCLVAWGCVACGHDKPASGEPLGVDASSVTPAAKRDARPAAPEEKTDERRDAAPVDTVPPVAAFDAAAPLGTSDTAAPAADVAQAGKLDAAPPSGGGKLPPAAAPAGNAAIPVLFIGNSYTYVNELPTILAKLVQAQGKRPIIVEREATGGQTLQGHFGDGNGPGPQAIEKRKWTYVVLQEQSMRPMNDFSAFLDYGKRLDALVDASGAQTMLFQTWSRKSAPADQKKLDDAYDQLGRAANAYLAPVGAAWARVRTERPAIELFAADGSHPSFAGSYLGACVFYSMIMAASPDGAPALDLPGDTATYLQKVAWDTVQAYRF